MSHKDPLVLLFQEWIGAFMRRSMHNWIFYLRDNELSMSQVGALFQIHRGKSNVSDLAEGLGISIAAASQMLERLVQQERIMRSEDPQDRRVKHLVLTAKGDRTVKESLQARQGWIEDLVSLLTPAEKEQVAAALKLMIDKTKQLDGRPETVR